MFCSKCGKEITDNSYYCYSCASDTEKCNNSDISFNGSNEVKDVFKIKVSPIVVKIILILLFVATLFPPYMNKLEGHVWSRHWDFLFTVITDIYKTTVLDLSTLFLEYLLIIIFGFIIQSFITHPIRFGSNTK